MVDTEKLNHWLSLLANFAVLFGLVALVVEIQTNTASIQSQEWGSIMDGFREVRSERIANSDVYMKALEDPSSLNLEEIHRASALISSRLLIMQSAFRAYKEGIATRDDWESLANSTQTFLGSKFGRTVWEEMKADFVYLPEFVNDIEEALERNTLAPDDEWYLNLQNRLKSD